MKAMYFAGQYTPTGTGLIHFRLNGLPPTINWKSPISILGTSIYDVDIPREKMAKLFANSGDPD